MSDLEFSNLIITLEKKFKKWGISILLTFLMGFGSLCYMVGGYKENWNNWRVDTDKQLQKHDKYIEDEQRMRNEARSLKNAQALNQQL